MAFLLPAVCRSAPLHALAVRPYHCSRMPGIVCARLQRSNAGDRRMWRGCSTDTGRQSGRVKRWSEDRGFGFIEPVGGGADVFVHHSCLNGCSALEVGQQVSFTNAWNEQKQKPWAADVDAQVPWDGQDVSTSPKTSQSTATVHAESSASSSAHVRQSTSCASASDDVKVEKKTSEHPDHESDEVTRTAHANQNERTPSASSSEKSVMTESSSPASGGTSSARSEETSSQHEENNLADEQTSLLKKLEQQTLDQQRNAIAQQEVGAALKASSSGSQQAEPPAVQAASSVHLPAEPMQVRPLQLPDNATMEQRLQLMAEHMEQLRLQGLQNQQLLLQGIYAMLQQQAAQTANLERAMLAIAGKVGASGTSEGESTFQAIGTSSALNGASPVQTTDQLANETMEKDVAIEQRQTLAGSKDELQTSSSSDTVVSRQSSNKSIKAKEKKPSVPSPEGKMSPPTSARSPVQAAEKLQAKTQASDKVPDDAKVSESPQNKKDDEGRNSIRKWTASSFHMVGSVNDWTIKAGHALPCSVTIRWTAPRAGDGDLRREEFQVVGDRSWEKRVYPAGDDKAASILVHPGFESPAAEGDGKSGHGRNWMVRGRPGDSFNIEYDDDNRSLVCRRV